MIFPQNASRQNVGDGVLDVPPPQRGGSPDACGIGGQVNAPPLP